MINTTRTVKGFCSLANENFEVEEPLVGEKPILKCPLCERVVFDLGGVLFHGKVEEESDDSSS